MAGRFPTSENLFPVSPGVTPGVVIGVVTSVCRVSLFDVSDGVAVSAPCEREASVLIMFANPLLGSFLVAFGFDSSSCLTIIWDAKYLNGSSRSPSECGTFSSANVQNRLSSSSSCTENFCLSMSGELGTK